MAAYTVTEIQCVGIYYHPRLDEAQKMANVVADKLRDLGRDVWVSAPLGTSTIYRASPQNRSADLSRW